MSDNVTITFTADISDLQRGLQQATGGVADATATMKAGAAQVATSFADLQRAYAAGTQQRLDLVKKGSDDELAIARAGDRAETDIALDAIKVKESQVREETQLAQVSHDEERAQLLALEDDREAIERRHLLFLQSTYRDNLVQYANVQRQIDELAAQSAVRRQQIEAAYARQVYNDYRTTFDQIAASMSQQVIGLISGQEKLRQAVAKVLLAMIQDFVAARLRMVADWAAGTAARTSAQQAGAAASAAASLIAIGKSIIASAAETFAGIFGFLSPILGPAAAGPAVAGQATVLAVGAGLPSFDTGAWSLPSDMVAQVHRGEMIVPAGPAAELRSALAGGAGGAPIQHHTHFNVTAMDTRDVRRFFSAHGRDILAAINDGVRNGSHLGLSRLGRG